jgi:hypothetical protein
VGLPWIQVDKEFARSPEAIALGSALGAGRHAAVGLCVEFWGWCSENAALVWRENGAGRALFWRVDGALASLIIDEAVGWRGEKSYAEAMIEVGLLERDDLGLVVVGSDRYAKVFEKAERDARRKRERRENGAGTARAVRAPGAGKSQIESQSQIKKEEEAVAAPLKQHLPRTIEPPTTPEETWTFQDFRRWGEGRRQASGLIPDKPPNDREGSSWWSACLMTPGVTTRAMKEGFYAFGDDPYWGKRGCPLRAFMSQWEKYVKPEVPSAATG